MRRFTPSRPRNSKSADVSRAILRHRLQQAARPQFVGLTDPGIGRQRPQHQDVKLLVAHRGVGFVKILVAQPDETIERLAPHGRPRIERIDRRGRLAGMRQYAQKIDESLFGDLRTRKQDRIGEVETVPIVQGQIVRPVGRIAQGLRHIGQPESPPPGSPVRTLGIRRVCGGFRGFGALGGFGTLGGADLRTSGQHARSAEQQQQQFVGPCHGFSQSAAAFTNVISGDCTRRASVSGLFSSIRFR